MKNDYIRPTVENPPEVFAAPPEYEKNGAPEFIPPPPEFGAGTRAQAAPKKKKRRSRFKQVLALPAVLLLGVLCLNNAVSPAKPARPVTPEQTTLSPEESTQPPEESTLPPEESTQPPEESTAAPETEPTAAYPLADREMQITVYSGTLNDAFEPVILLQERVNELSFADKSLEPPEDIDDFSFYGYVIHAGNPVLRPEGEPPGTPQMILPIDLTLTRAAVEQTPVASDGVRYVDIYANWISDTMPENSYQTFVLDDGMGHEKEFDASSPMYSEGFLYIEAYPETEREGLVFDGYYNQDGERVYALQSFMDFFEPSVYDDNGNVLDVDTNRPLDNIVLKAHWRPAK